MNCLERGNWVFCFCLIFLKIVNKLFLDKLVDIKFLVVKIKNNFVSIWFIGDELKY